ncbi:MAG: hypothetical protein A2W80_07490 [Candidatus Riflebacteria bacterium GWC2_50_8]|nr:MAG: hypothetical protein A2W80_07490 [Candidatus Riflebacteria bacterium GWC2_50_8]
MDASLKDLFREGASEYLLELEEALLHLSENPDDSKEIDRVFRVMHSLKGSAAMVELDRVASFAHALESEFDFMRRGLAKVSRAVIKQTLMAHDALKDMIHDDSEVAESCIKKILEKLQKARMETMADDSGFCIDHAFVRTDQLIADIAAFSDDIGNRNLFAKISQHLAWLYIFAMRNSNESIAEFVGNFDCFVRQLVLKHLPVDKDLPGLLAGVAVEIRKMLSEILRPEEQSFDPDFIMAAMQRPLDLKAQLETIMAGTSYNDAALPAIDEYIVTLTLDKSGVGPFSSGAAVISLLARFGEVSAFTAEEIEDDK